ncbi:MAG TPA: DUF3300 domain-containing protein [Burkholderiales bacterium]
MRAVAGLLFALYILALTGVVPAFGQDAAPAAPNRAAQTGPPDSSEATPPGSDNAERQDADEPSDPVDEPDDAAPAAEGDRYFSQAELDQLLAPIALYPDGLLSQILMAATYPLEVVQAARWSRANPGLSGAEAVKAVEGESWDPSVKSLVAFPQVLQMMDEKLEWTRDLGDAFLAHRALVMDTVQNLRKRAYDAGTLRSNQYYRVERRGDHIVIEPANPEVVYVPYYDPRVVYGTWWWPAYPPVFWAPWPGYHPFAGTGFFWSVGVFVGPRFFFGFWDWPHRHIHIVHVHDRVVPKHRARFKHPHFKHPRFKHPSRIWRHDPRHRHGVKYRHPGVRRAFAPPHDGFIRRASGKLPHERRAHEGRPGKGGAFHRQLREGDRHFGRELGRRHDSGPPGIGRLGPRQDRLGMRQDRVAPPRGAQPPRFVRPHSGQQRMGVDRGVSRRMGIRSRGTANARITAPIVRGAPRARAQLRPAPRALQPRAISPTLTAPRLARPGVGPRPPSGIAPRAQPRSFSMPAPRSLSRPAASGRAFAAPSIGSPRGFSFRR